MGSRFLGVPISSAHVTPRAALSYNAKSPGIRAPLTADESDFEFSASSKSRRNSTTSSYYSGSELEYDGSASDEDELHNVTSKPGQDDEIHYNDERAFSATFVKNPDGEGVKERCRSYEDGLYRASAKKLGGEGGGVSVFRPFVRNPNGITFKGLGEENESEYSSSFSGDSDEEIFGGSSHHLRDGYFRPSVAAADEEAYENESSSDMDHQLSLVPKSFMPFAQISRDSDNDSQGSADFLENDGLAGMTTVPRTQLLQRLYSASKISVLEVEMKEDFVPVSENMVVSNDVLISSEFEEHVKDMDTNVSEISVDIIQSQDLDVSCKVETVSLADDKNNGSMAGSDAGGEEDLMRVEKDVKEIYAMDDDAKYVDLVDHGLYAEEAMLQGHFSGDHSDAEPRLNPVPINLEELESNGNSFSAAVPMDDLVFDQAIQSDEFEEKRQVGPTIETISIKGLNQVVEIEEKLNGGCLRFSELHDALIDSKNVCQEIICEAEHSEQIPVEVENPTVRMPDVMELVVEVEEHASYSLSGGEILSNHGPASNAQKILDLDEEVNIARNLDQFNPPEAQYPLKETLSEGEEELKRIQQIRVKYLQFLHALCMSSGDSISTKVLYQLEIAEASSFSKEFLFATNTKAAMDLEACNKTDLNLSLSILVIGKTGVGKSATINSIFGERKTVVDAFEPGTTDVKEITGMIDGVKVKVFDSPGFRTCLVDRFHNRKVLLSIKRLIKRSPPDIVLYVDRLDMQMHACDDYSLLKSVSTYVGSSVWSKTIVALTHATCTPPDGPNGHPLNYDVFVSQRSNSVRQMINFSAAMNPGLKIPIALVENHPCAETLPHDGGNWRAHLLLLCYSMKTLLELSSVFMTRNPLAPGRRFGFKIPSLSLQSPASNLSDNLQTEWGFPLKYDHENVDYFKLPQIKIKPVIKKNLFADKEMRNQETVDMESIYPSSRYHLFEIEDQISVKKCAPACKEGFEVRQDLGSLCLSVVKRKSDLTWGCSLKSQFGIGKNSKLRVQAGWNDNRLQKQVSIRTRSSNPLQITLLSFLVIANAIHRNIFPGDGQWIENYLE